VVSTFGLVFEGDLGNQRSQAIAELLKIDKKYDTCRVETCVCFGNLSRTCFGSGRARWPSSTADRIRLTQDMMIVETCTILPSIGRASQFVGNLSNFSITRPTFGRELGGIWKWLNSGRHPLGAHDKNKLA